MNLYRVTIKPESAFGTPLVGDTLFGQLCWAIVHRFGEEKLNQLLCDYHQQPFMVVSDAFPRGYVPLPCLPSKYWEVSNETDRKKLKKKQWVSLLDLNRPVSQWQKLAKSDQEIIEEINGGDLGKKSWFIEGEHTHNTINRTTNMTGIGQFSPYTTKQIWYENSVLLDLYVLLNEEQVSLERFTYILNDTAKIGYGRDASIGLGKFSFDMPSKIVFSQPSNSTSYLTLANTALQNTGLNPNLSFYQLVNRFGRHGDMFAISGSPFKKPLLLAKTGAVLTPTYFKNKLYWGNGLVGVSNSCPTAVHQGYAPVIPFRLCD